MRTTAQQPQRKGRVERALSFRGGRSNFVVLMPRGCRVDVDRMGMDGALRNLRISARTTWLKMAAELSWATLVPGSASTIVGSALSLPFRQGAIKCPRRDDRRRLHDDDARLLPPTCGAHRVERRARARRPQRSREPKVISGQLRRLGHKGLVYVCGEDRAVCRVSPCVGSPGSTPG